MESEVACCLPFHAFFFIAFLIRERKANVIFSEKVKVLAEGCDQAVWVSRSHGAHLEARPTNGRGS